MTLEGKKAVITGGGRGIGAAVARALAEQGVEVMVAARNAGEVEQVARELRAQGARAEAQVCDVTDPAQVAALAAAAADRLGPVDILVNNAGVAPSAPLRSIRLEEWNRTFAVNTTGTMLCTQAFVPGMVERGWGRVVNIASIAARTGAAYIATYAASKHAVLGFTRSVAAELAPTGVTINAVCPGYVDTGMTDESVARIVGKTGLPREQAVEAILKTSPQHRLLDPAEVAYLVVCLCDPRARGINGQAVVLDGGSLLA